MENTAYQRATGALMMFTAGLALTSQAALVKLFDFPNIFALPIGTVLEKYHDAGAMLPWAWFGFAMASLLIIPIALMLHKIFRREDTPWLTIGTVFGSIAGFCYVLGIMRWVLLARVLSDLYVDPATTPAAKETITLIFKAFDVYCGNSFGETIAPIAHAAWLILLGGAMRKAPRFGPWLPWSQIIAGAIIALRPLEYVGCKAAADLSDATLGVWVLLIAIMGVLLLRHKDPLQQPERS